MNPTTEILRGELERLFELDDMITLSKDLLGFDPKDVGGTAGKGAFARALVDRCASEHALEALAEAILLTPKGRGATLDVRRILEGADGDVDLAVKVGEYSLVRKLGEGGLGVVYLATAADGREIALKIIRPGFARDRSSVYRFLTVTRALKSADAPGLAQIIDVGELPDGRPWVASELIAGQTLAARIARLGPIHIQEARPLFVRVLETLSRLHQSGIVHGHVKAENVFVGVDTAEGMQPRLIDGGSDRLAARRYSNGAGVVPLFGTAKSLDPAVVRGSDRSAQTDLYAVAIMLYEALAGRPPFIGATAMDVVAQQLVAEPVAPSTYAPRGWVAPAVDELVLRALSKDPAHRFNSAADFLRALEEVSTRKSSMEPAAPLDRPLFEAAVIDFRSNPSDEAAAETVEQLVAPALAWDEAVQLFANTAAQSQDRAIQKSLLLRVARIHRIEQSDSARAREAYEAVLRLDASDRDAQRGLLDLLRSSGDPEALVDALLERAEQEEDHTLRAALLEEIARTYEDRVGSPDNALVAWAQALAEMPERAQYMHEIERLATTQDQWNDVITALSEAAQEAQGTPAASRIYLILSRWYSTKLKHADFALECLSRALENDATNEEAYDAMGALYEKSQSWRELVELLERRAEVASSPVRSRNFLTKAAEVVLERFGDGGQAEQRLLRVLSDDPASPKASELLESIYTRGQRWTELTKLFVRRAENETGERRAKTLVRAGELAEDQLDDLTRALGHYEKALEADGSELDALKGLERVYSRQGNYADLFQVLERGLKVAATTKQKTGILSRMAAIVEEEFGERERAVRTYEQVVELDASHEDANAALARFYKQDERWDLLVATYERHAQGSTDANRKAELLVRAAETLSTRVGTPARALAVVERALEVAPSHTGALELFASLQTSAGDKGAAVQVFDRLAESEKDPRKKAEQWLRAGRLAEEKGDRAGAEERFKRALDADANHTEARVALRRLFTSGGDVHGAVELLTREINETPGDSQKAKLHAELGAICLEGAKDAARAKQAFETALQLDGTCTPAALGLGDIAFESGDWLVAARHYEPLLARTSSLTQEQAKRACLRCGDAFRALKEHGKAERAYLNARSIAPNDRDVLERAADAAFEAGSFEDAGELYAEILERAGDKISDHDRGQLLMRAGETAHKRGDSTNAVKKLEEATRLLASDPMPLEILAAVHQEQKRWDQALSALEKALTRASDDQQRFDVYSRLGDLAFAKAGDRAKAIEHYRAALAIKGDARNVLTKLMAIYSEQKSWPELVEVILRIADLVDDRAQVAKYFRTVGSICLSELKKPEEAVHYYSQALDADPTADDAFQGLANCLEVQRDYAGLAAAYKDQIVRNGNDASAERRAALWEGLGRVYARNLDDVTQAIDAYEKALVLVPGNAKVLEDLVALYDRDPERYGDKARVIHESIIASDPGRIASYNSLYRLLRHRGDVDGAWCISQTLRCLGHADNDQKEFFKARRVKSTLAASASMDGQTWRELVVHPDQDPLLTAIFTTITPVVVQTNAQALAAYRLAPDARLDVEADTTPMVQALRYAGWVAEVPLPELYRRADDQGGLSFLFTAPPAIGLGAGAYVSLPSHVVGFVAARHLSYLQPGHYVRYLVPSGSGLKAWLLAAIRLVQPTFPVPAEFDAQVSAFQGALEQQLHEQLRAVLEKLVQSLLQTSPSLDLRRWSTAIDKTADRLGLIVANDLEHAIAVIAASPEDASFVARDERIAELQAYSASPQYLRLRQKLGAVLTA